MTKNLDVREVKHNTSYRAATNVNLQVAFDSSCILYQAKPGSVYAGSRNKENLDCSPQHYFSKLCFFSLPYSVFWQVRTMGRRMTKNF